MLQKLSLLLAQKLIFFLILHFNVARVSQKCALMSQQMAFNVAKHSFFNVAKSELL